MTDMRIRHIPWGPFVNKSEELATDYLDKRLKSDSAAGEWTLLTNLSLTSGRDHYLPVEIDILAIGSTCVQVIEVKHWDRTYISSSANSPELEKEAAKANDKAKIVASKLRKAGYSNLGFISAKLLLTRTEKERFKKGSDRTAINGIEVYSLSEWKELLEVDGRTILDRNDINAICKVIAPLTGPSVSPNLRSFGPFTDLLPAGQYDPFRRVFFARRKLTRDKLILHLYDLSAFDQKEALSIARREFDVLQKLQKSPYLPSLLDSFQEVSSYPGELYFFSYLDPEAATLEDRAKDEDWGSEERILAAQHCLKALMDFHQNEGGSILHRNLTPHTIRIRSNNGPLFTQMQFARIPGASTLTGAIAPEFQGIEDYVAPEIRSLGLGSCTVESDIYALCASLSILFKNHGSDAQAIRALGILEGGLASEPSARKTLQTLIGEFALEHLAIPPPEPIRVEFWDEDTVRVLNDRHYRIVSKLGSGSVGKTFKVMEVDPRTGDELSGPYVAKAITNQAVGEEATKAYARIRGQTGGSHLAGVLEVANTWKRNEITALLRWIEGDPLSEWRGVLPLYLEELGEGSPEEVLLSWIHDLCTGLSQMHCAGLVHGDLSPKNIIVGGANVTLTDYDLSTTDGSVPIGGTPQYCAPSVDRRSSINRSDDIYALASSFFEVLFDRAPFLYPHGIDKSHCLNWEGIDRSVYPRLPEFFDKATNPDPTLRYPSAMDAIAAIDSLLKGQHQEERPTCEQLVSAPVPGMGQILTKNNVPWLGQLLQAYPSSPKGNAETRGLDSPFAWQTYVETRLDDALAEEIRKGKINLVILCGNAGDGKTAFLQNLAKNLEVRTDKSSERLWNVTLERGIMVRANLDGAAAFQGRSAHELLDEFFAPFQSGTWSRKIVHLVAINDGPLLAWLEEQEETWLTNQLYALLQPGEKTEVDERIRFIDLNLRSLVGGCQPGKDTVSTDFLDRILDKTLGDQNTWESCTTCIDQSRCPAWRSVRSLRHPQIGPVIRSRLTRALQAIHQRGEIHITARSLRAALNYIFFGYYDCHDLHEDPNLRLQHYWDRAFDPKSEYRQGELLAELRLLDPSLDSHPRIDRWLLRGSAFADDPGTEGDKKLASLRRRAYFEWSDDQIREIGGSETALNLSNGKHLSSFLQAGIGNDDERRRICQDLCEGIARLEDLPEKAFVKDWVPLRITPRTPTETAFWVNKPRERFSLRPRIMLSQADVDVLHTHLVLSYSFEKGHKEELMLGADLFHLLMELKDGYQLSDVRSDDIFANLSIFKQRVAQEEERVLFAWNPMDDRMFQIAIENDEGLQNIAIKALIGEKKA